jgi:drug/metabolite transporter (DMT)-like permease
MAATPKLKRALFLTLQALLLAFAAVCIFYGQHNFAIRSVGLLAIFGGLILVRNSRRSSSAIRVHNKPTFSVKPWQWLVGLVLLVALAAALAWLFYDAATGYGSGIAPIYVFIAATLFCSLWWGAIFIRWLSW